MGRSDAVLATDVPGYRRFMPALMPTRGGSTVYFDQQVRVAGAERLVAAVRESRPGVHATFFHVVLWALARTIGRHPHLNRFVAGGRVYDRDGIWISFTAKTEMSDTGVLTEVKRRFDAAQPFVDLVRDVQAAKADVRGGGKSAADRELQLFLHLPPILRRGVVVTAGAANALNLLPAGFIERDPFFASAFVTNLGSVGLDAAFHHLYEYGTIPIFCAVGRVHEAPVADGGRPAVGRVASIKFSYDERVEDGLYAALALEEFKAMVEEPAAALG